MPLSNQQYDSLMRRYERIRLANRHLEKERLSEVYRRIPEFEALDSSLGSFAVSRVKSLLDGDDSVLAAVHESAIQVQSKKRALLVSAGFSADYLDPIYACPACKDTGYIETEDFQKQKCSCLRAMEISLLYRQSNIQDVISQENFSTLSYDYYQGEDLERFQGAVKICKDFVQNFEHDYHNLFFYGTVGTGKSFLSGCVAHELLNSGHSVIYFSSIGLFELLARYTFDTKDKGELHSLYEDIYNSDLIIIDDLGTEMTNNFVTSQLFSCLNERNIRKKATIISTNLSLEELRDRYSDRIFSRITSNYTLCKLTGPDIRMHKKLSTIHTTE